LAAASPAILNAGVGSWREGRRLSRLGAVRAVRRDYHGRIAPRSGGAQFAVRGLVLLIALVAAIYTIGLSAGGGVLGTYLKQNR